MGMFVCESCVAEYGIPVNPRVPSPVNGLCEVHLYVRGQQSRSDRGTLLQWAPGLSRFPKPNREKLLVDLERLRRSQEKLK